MLFNRHKSDIVRPLRGIRRTSSPKLRFIIEQPIEFHPTSANIFVGANAAGKTTFIEKVVIRYVESRGVATFVWGADSSHAELAARMMVAVKHAITFGTKSEYTELISRHEVLKQAISVFPAFAENGVLILDESLPSVADFYDADVAHKLKSPCWCIIRHDPADDIRTLKSLGFFIRVYQFDRLGGDVIIKEVTTHEAAN